MDLRLKRLLQDQANTTMKELNALYRLAATTESMIEMTPHSGAYKPLRVLVMDLQTSLRYFIRGLNDVA